MKKFVYAFLLLTFMSCGLKFSSLPHNKAIPDDLKNRTFWKKTDIFKYNLSQLTGSIIYVPSDGDTFRGARFVSSTNPPTIETIKDGLIYSSKINRNFNSNVSVLSFAASLDSKQMVDIKVTDVLQSFINYEDIPIEEIKNAKVPPSLKGYKRYYIQGALLTSVLKKYSTEISANASGVVGGAYGADGKVYNEDKTIFQDYRISLALIDLDKLNLLIEASPLLNTDEEIKNILKSSISSEIKIDEIKTLE